MTPLDDETVLALLREGEGFRVERKASLAGNTSDAIREAICAFANDLPGSGDPGVVFVGVQDDGRPANLAIDDRLLLQLSDMKTDGTIVPPPSLLVEKRRLAGADVAVVTVFPSDSPPVRYKGGIRVRIGPRRGLATAQDERVLNERRRFGDRPFDSQPVPGTSTADLNRRQFEDEYLPNAFDSEVLAANERDLSQRLAATKMIASVEQPMATIVGLLVLGIRPRDFIPGAYVQFLRLDGEDLSDPIIDADDIDGTISDIMRRLDEKLRAHIHASVDLTGADRERRTVSYPLAALQQFARNAVMHRTYEATNAPVRVTWFNDRVEIISPGGPFGQVTRDNFGRPGITDYRNPNLAEAMRVLGYVQRFGVGIGTARRALRDAGFPEPSFSVEDTTVMVTVRGGARA